MFLSDKKQLLARFPPLELSYENVLHKKVSADLYMLIPVGQKAFVLFTYWQDKNVCLVLLLNAQNNICDIKLFSACFDAKLVLGTVIYGTIFSHNNLTHFTCEDLFYYKGTNVDKGTNITKGANISKGANITKGTNRFLHKLAILSQMFQTDIKQIAYTSEFLILGLPIMKKNYEHALACINGLPYKIHGINFISCNSTLDNYVLGIYKFHTPNLPEAIFTVKPLLSEDIYELYCQAYNIGPSNIGPSNIGPSNIDPSNIVPYNSIAFIPSYKCSIMMNSLFRHIKENANLDLLEESDTEDEYENTNISKFVDLEKSYKMRCVYMRKFRKWQPIEVVDEKTPVNSYKEIQALENNLFENNLLGKG